MPSPAAATGVLPAASGASRSSSSSSGRTAASLLGLRCCQVTVTPIASDRDEEEHRRQHVDLDRDAALRGAEDVEREGHRRARS